MTFRWQPLEFRSLFSEFTRVFFLDTAGVVFLCCGDCVSCARGSCVLT